jgi:hypothetical protein
MTMVSRHLDCQRWSHRHAQHQRQLCALCHSYVSHVMPPAGFRLRNPSQESVCRLEVCDVPQLLIGADWAPQRSCEELSAGNDVSETKAGAVPRRIANGATRDDRGRDRRYVGASRRFEASVLASRFMIRTRRGQSRRTSCDRLRVRRAKGSKRSIHRVEREGGCFLTCAFLSEGTEKHRDCFEGGSGQTRILTRAGEAITIHLRSMRS